MRRLKELIETNKRFLITSHVNVEPDALGSELAFAKLLKKLGKRGRIVNSDITPKRYLFMPGASDILSLSELKGNFDVAVILDCSDLNRIGKVRDFLTKEMVVINIDHHISNTKFGQLNIVDRKASSVSEIIFRIFKDFNLKLDRDVATNLYCGILTDTGSFRYSNTTASTFKVVSELLKFGFDLNWIYRELYRIEDFSYTRLIGRFLQCAKTFHKGEVVYLALPEDINVGDVVARDLAELALNILRLIKGAKVFVLLRRLADSDFVRINLRSNSNVDVNAIANVFGGGGHTRASSATVRGNLASVKAALLKEITKYL